MTADATWPYATLVPRTPYPRLAGTSMSGGRSLSGKLQTVGVDAPFWLITLGGIPIRNDTHIEAWRVVELALDGRLGTCLVPFYDGKRAPWPNGMGGATIVASADGAMAVGATSGAIDMTTGAAPKPGMFWSAGERGYQLKTVGAPTGTIYPVTFRRPCVRPSPTTIRWNSPIPSCAAVCAMMTACAWISSCISSRPKPSSSKKTYDLPCAFAAHRGTRLYRRYEQP
jgi:hypothetical protein